MGLSAEKVEKAKRLGLEFWIALEIFSQNAATTVLVIEDIINNHFDKIDVIEAMEEMKDGMAMTATDFIELCLPEEYTKIHKSKLKSKRFHRIREGFYLYHLKNIPIMFNYKLHKRNTHIESWQVEAVRKLSMSEEEIRHIYSQCGGYALEQKLVRNEEAFIHGSAYLFNETISHLDSFSRFYVTEKKGDKGIDDILNDSRWLLEDGLCTYYSMENNSHSLDVYSLYKENDKMEGNLALVTKLILKEHYKTLFWDSVRDKF